MCTASQLSRAVNRGALLVPANYPSLHPEYNVSAQALSADCIIITQYCGVTAQDIRACAITNTHGIGRLRAEVPLPASNVMLCYPNNLFWFTKLLRSVLRKRGHLLSTYTRQMELKLLALVLVVCLGTAYGQSKLVHVDQKLLLKLSDVKKVEIDGIKLFG